MARASASNLPLALLGLVAVRSYVYDKVPVEHAGEVWKICSALTRCRSTCRNCSQAVACPPMMRVCLYLCAMGILKLHLQTRRSIWGVAKLALGEIRGKCAGGGQGSGEGGIQINGLGFLTESRGCARFAGC